MCTQHCFVGVLSPSSIAPCGAHVVACVAAALRPSLSRYKQLYTRSCKSRLGTGSFNRKDASRIPSVDSAEGPSISATVGEGVGLVRPWCTAVQFRRRVGYEL